MRIGYAFTPHVAWGPSKILVSKAAPCSLSRVWTHGRDHLFALCYGDDRQLPQLEQLLFVQAGQISGISCIGTDPVRLCVNFFQPMTHTRAFSKAVKQALGTYCASV